MKIVIAPNAFKESLSSLEVCKALSSGFKKIYTDATYQLLPIADGGEGTALILTMSCNGIIKKKSVAGPLGNYLTAIYGLSPDNKMAFIECAETCGIALLPTCKLNPIYTTTYGTGELILHALNKNVKTIIIGVGGTATNDGGIGLLTAVGIKFFDKNGVQLCGIGDSLSKIETIDVTNLDSRIKKTEIIIASDVTNPLYGPLGAAKVYAKQKGASKEVIEQLDQGLIHYAEKIQEYLGIDVQTISGSGSGGGIGAGLFAFLNAKMLSGFDIVKEYIRLEESIMTADLVLTGEGKIDSQTAMGKGPLGVAQLAKKYDKKVIAFAAIRDEVDIKEFDQIHSLLAIGEVSKNKDYSKSFEQLEQLATEVARENKEGRALV